MQMPAALRGPWAWPLAVAASWFGPLIAYLLGVAWVLPVALVAVLAGLQRGARTGTDRLVLAVVQLFGALCVAGLLFSVWPWRLHPVPMAGSGFTALVVVAFVTRRGWSLPRALPTVDRLVLAASAGVAMLAAVPFALRDLGGRIGIVAPGEDMGRHLVLSDLIGLVGGYAFMHPDRAAPYLADSVAAGIRNYPQGTHFGYAVLDRFIRSASTSADGLTHATVAMWLYVATFGFLGLAVLWGLRRVAGPGADAVRLLPVLGVAAVWVYFGDPVAVFTRGYPNQLVGMALVAVLTAIVVRPLTSLGDQLVAVALLLVGISFSYHLFLPYAGLAVAVWAVRAKLWRRAAAWLVAVAALPAVAVTPLLNLYATTAGQLSSAGTARPVDRPALVALVALALAGLLLRGGRRSPARRAAALTLGAALAVSAALGVFQLVTIGRTIYYFEKTLQTVIVVALVCLGGLVRLVPRRGPERLGRLAPALVARLAPALAAVLFVVGLGGPTHTTVGSPGLKLLVGSDPGSPGGGADAVFMTRRHPDGGGAVNVDLMDTPYRNWFGTYFGSALQRRYRYGHDWYGYLNPLGPPKTLADLESMVRDSPVPVRFFVYNPRARLLADGMTNIEAARYLADRYPGKVEVIQAVPPAP